MTNENAEEWYEEYETEEERKWREAAEEEALEQLMAEYQQAVLTAIGMLPDSYGNSCWVAALLECISNPDSFLDAPFSSLYPCASLYTALLYLVLDENAILDPYMEEAYESFHNSDESVVFASREDLENYLFDEFSLQELWHETADYTQLKERFGQYKMDAADLPEILLRNRAKAQKDCESLNLLEEVPESCMAIKQFIRQGNHTIMELYHELTTNPLYRQELLQISGSLRNPDLEISKRP